MDGANFLAGERVMVLFVTPSPGHEEGEDGKQNSRQSHKPSFSGAPRTRNSSAARPKNHRSTGCPPNPFLETATRSSNCRFERLLAGEEFVLFLSREEMRSPSRFVLTAHARLGLYFGEGMKRNNRTSSLSRRLRSRALPRKSQARFDEI